MKRFLVAAIALVWSISAAATEDISYMWAELRFEHYDADRGGEVDGVGASFNFHIDERFYIPAQFLSGDFDSRSSIGGSSNVTLWNAGIGYHQPVNATGDFLVELKYEDVDFDDGVSLAGGFRNQLRDGIESKIILSVADLDGTAVALEGGLLFELWNEFGLSLDAQVDDDSNWAAGVGLRWSF